MGTTSKSKAAKQRVVPDDLEAIVREALLAAPGIKGSQLKKALPKPYQPFDKEARALAQELALSGAVFRVPKGKDVFYFERDPMLALDGMLPDRLAEGPLDKNALKELVTELLPGHASVLDDWLKQAIARGLVFEHAALPPSKAKRYAREPDVRKSLGAVLTALRKALGKTDAQGISRQRVAEVLLGELGVSTLPEARVGGNGGGAPREQFLAALKALVAENPRQALLSIRDLRPRLRLSKEQFDSVALELSQDGAVSLHHHDHPMSLSEQERHQLVRDARGTFYIGIAPRTVQ